MEMKHYILFNMLSATYVILSISIEDNPNDVGLSSDWIIHGPHDDHEAAKIQWNRLVTSQKEFK